MKLYATISLETFIKENQGTSPHKALNLRLENRLEEKYEEEYDYGLSLLRQAIGNYERKHGIDKNQRKSAMPFFREHKKLLVGPELQLYASRLFESCEACGNDDQTLVLTLKHGALGEHCIFENLFLSKCKYDEQHSIHYFEEQLETEYDKFFYDDAYFGFTPDSRFFSLLCNACLGIRRPEQEEEREWYLAALLMPEDSLYRFEQGRMISFSCTSIPWEAVKQISLPRYQERAGEYTALAGFLKQKGLNPEGLLEGYE